MRDGFKQPEFGKACGFANPAHIIDAKLFIAIEALAR
jgi:hypothetical protein